MNNDSPQVNKKKIYVGNLPWSLNEDDVRELCEPYGEVTEAKLITDFKTGRSRGFAFVTFADEEAAENALENLHQQEVEGRQLFVKVARPKSNDDRRGGGRDRGGNDRRGGNRY